MYRSDLDRLLQGGYIEAYDFDMREAVIAMRVDVMVEDRLHSYEIRFDRVSRLVYDTEQSWFGSDYRLQVTEIYIDNAPESSQSEEWQVKISIWDMGHLTIRCSSVLIDGEPLM